MAWRAVLKRSKEVLAILYELLVTDWDYYETKAWLAGKDLLSVSLRQSLNLVAFSVVENSEGEHASQLRQLFKGQITYREFEQWADAQKPPEEQNRGLTPELLAELEEFKEQNNGNRSVAG